MDSEIQTPPNPSVELSPLSGEPKSDGYLLAIDDDDVTLGVLRDLLMLHGYRVLTAGEGREGIDIFSEKRPHVVITDIRMPCLDGLEVLRRVKEIDDTVPVILVTGHGDLENAIKALREGAYDFLQKPINTEIMLNTVRQAMEHFRLRNFERNYTRVLERQVEERTRELARTADFLKGILDSSTGVSIVLTDFDERVVFWNTGAEKIFGYTVEEMKGRKVDSLYLQDASTRRQIDALRKWVEKESGTAHGKVKQIAKDGRLLTLSVAMSPMWDPEGNVRGILSLGQDVTEEMRLHDELKVSFETIKRVQGSAIFALAKLAETRDEETAYHLERIQLYCRVLSAHLRTKERFTAVLSDQFIDDLVMASVLHDIGKVAIPDSILFNPNKFGIDEYEIMKQHTHLGGKALDEAASETGEESVLSIGRDIAYYHHERWDGSGYPEGLRGAEIPLVARIVSVADVYDALTTERRYKKAFSHREAISVIAEQSGRQFDPQLVEAFLEIADEFARIREKLTVQSHPIHLAGYSD